MAFPKKIEPKQCSLIHIAKKQCQLSDDEYRAIIAAQTNGAKHSSKDLTYPEADAVINYFVKTLGFKIRTRAPRRRRYPSGCSAPSNVFVLASPDQLEMINALVSKIVWKFEDGYERWRSKYMKISRIKSDKEASTVIEGLKGLLAHQVQNCHYSPGENIA